MRTLCFGEDGDFGVVIWPWVRRAWFGIFWFRRNMFGIDLDRSRLVPFVDVRGYCQDTFTSG